MHKSRWLYKLVALFVVFIFYSAIPGEFKDEKELIKTANKQFEAGKYEECIELYSQLVSNYAQNPEYLYKYGTCLLFATEDKLQSLKYLKFATSKKDVAPEAYYYYGKALQINYEFDKAIIQYKKYKVLAKPKEVSARNVDHLIDQCKTANKMIYNFKKLDVVSKKTVDKKEFFRSYRLGSMKRNIIVTPEDFQTKQDKKAEEYSLIVHNPMNEVVYFSSYNSKGNLGGKDIFKVLKMPDGTFSEPVNLGPAVNTKMDEDYPYLHPNGRVLYFASKGRNGLGGYDIFRSELDTNTNLWGYAENVGFSINSPADDILYVSDMDESIAYFASNRTNKNGEMTVYKILPNRDQAPVVIVRGEVEVEGSQNHSANITVFNHAGEVLSVYNSNQSSGNFIMTLEEDNTYLIGVATPGRGEVKTKLQVPKKSEWDMISKKFVVKENGTIEVQDTPEMLASKEEKLKLFRASANLDINQEKDVDFNTKINRPKSKLRTAEEPDLTQNSTTDENETADENLEESIESVSEDILSNAKQELENIQKSKEKVKKQIDATYYVANKKKIKADIIKDEIEQLSEELSIAYSDEEKEVLTTKIKDKRNELKANSASATAAIQLAKTKERELEVKQKQEKLAQTYVNAIEKASSSNNTSTAIAELEKTKEEMDKLSEEIEQIKENDGSAETMKKSELAKKKLADLQVKQQTVEQDIADLKAEQKDLKNQAEKTKNKGLKEELLLQSDELNKEIAEAEVQNNIIKSKIAEAESEYEILSSAHNVYNEVYSEAEDEALVAISEDQKQNIQAAVKSQNSQINKESEIAINSSDESNELTNESSGENQLSSPYSSKISSIKDSKNQMDELQQQSDLLSSTLSAKMDPKRKKSIEDKISDINKQKVEIAKEVKQKIDELDTEIRQLPEAEQHNFAQEITEIKKIKNEVEQLEQVESTPAADSSVEPKTAVIALDVEGSTAEERRTLLAESSGIQYSVGQNDQDFSELEELEKSVAKKLIEANKIQVEYENNGGEGEAPKAKKLKEAALEDQFKLVDKQREIKTNDYERKKEELEKLMFTQDGLATDEIKQKATEVSDYWIKANLKHEAAQKAKDEQKKVELINEAIQLEQQAFDEQKELENKINEAKEALLASNKNSNIDNKVDTPNATTKTQEQSKEPYTKNDFGNPIVKVTPSEYNPESPSEEAVLYANEEGYGIQRDVDFAYTNSASVNTALNAAKEEEKIALNYFYEAEKLKASIKDNPEKEKKILKQAEKLMNKGKKVQEDANEKYRALNEAELEFNKSEIDFALEYNEIEKKDSARLLQKEAEKLFEEAKDLRKKAAKTKNYEEATALINQAYKKELDALNKQNYVISGELDGNDESTEVPTINIPKREENEYTRQADAIRKQAELEEDSYEKRKLFEEARMYDLAGNKDRTQRMLEDLNADKVTYQNNNFLIGTARKQSHNNLPANKAYFAELESDSLFKVADSLSTLANNETDEVKRLKLITAAKDGMRSAKEKQAYAIRKYSESKAAPDQAGFIAVFRSDSSEVLAVSKVESPDTPEDNQSNTSIENNTDEPVQAEESELALNATETETETGTETQGNVGANIFTEDATELEGEITAQKSETQEEPNSNPEIGAETVNSENLTGDEVNSEQEVREIASEENNNLDVGESYKMLIQEADAAEAQEAERVDEIVHLKNQAGINRNKSEELLAQVDGLTNEAEIMKKISEANKFRALAEEQEIEAKNKELILKNNVAEARAKRKEAEMIISTLNDDEKEAVIAATQNSDPDLVKVRSFLGDENAESTEKVAPTTAEENEEVVSNVVNTQVVDNNVNTEVSGGDSEENTSVNPKIDLNNIQLLDEGGAENSIVEDEFNIGSSATYSSASNIPVDPQLPNGIIYQVQVGAFKNKIDPSIFNGLSPLVGETTSTGIIRYKVGYFRGFKSANMAKGRIRNLGYRDAFVVVFYNGERISLDEADEVIKNADESEKFVYDNLVEDEVQKLKALGIKEDEGEQDPTDITTSPVVVAQNPGVNQSGQITSANAGLNNNLLDINGLFFTVQVGVFSSPRSSADLNGVAPLYTEKTSNGYLRYTTGVYRDYSSADQRKEVVRNQGVRDAFVTAYNDNKRINVNSARELQGNTTGNEAVNSNATENNQSGEVVFRVQVGAYRSEVDINKTPVLNQLTNYDITTTTTSSGLVVYMVGSFKTKAEANAFTSTVKQAGGSDCFVTATLNGQRISMQRALELTK